MADTPTCKICAKCSETKPLDQFHNLSRAADGKNYRCKLCVMSEVHRYREHGAKEKEALPTGTKRCTTCKEVKDLESFRLRKDIKDGRSSRCRACMRIADAKSREKHRDRIISESRRYYAKNQVRLRREYREQYAECIKNPEFVEKQRVKALRFSRKFSEKRRKYARERRKDPEVKEKQRQYNREYHRRNRDKIIARAMSRLRERYLTCPDFRAYLALRSILDRKLREVKKGDVFHVSEVELPYTSDDLKKRMECQFEPGMDWTNHGSWHVDHKIPVSVFLSRGETRPHIIHALSNLQPLWKEENLRKGNRWVG